MKRKLLSTFLVLTFVLAFAAPTFAYSDTDGHWAKKTIDHWTDYKVVQGDETGTFRPDGNLTRGEMATVFDNMMDYQVLAKNIYSDLDANQWYGNAVLKATAAGIIKGDDVGTVRPMDSITREESVLVFARMLGLDGKKAPETKYADKAKISTWAVEAVNVMTEKGYIQGYENKFNPQGKITRAEIMTIVDNIFKEMYQEAKEYSKDVKGSAIINTKDVVLKNMTIDGDLIIAEGVGDGNVTLDNVTVKGQVIVRGGGENSIIIKGDSSIATIIADRQDGKVRISVEDGAKVSVIYVDDRSNDIKIEGTVADVKISGKDLTVEVTGNVTNIALEGAAAGSKIVVANNATVKNIDVKAANSTVDVKGEVAKVTTTADAVKVQGDGNITNITAESGKGLVVDKNTVVKEIKNETKDPIKVGDIDVPAGETHSHAYGDWTVTKAATCTEVGSENRVCPSCKSIETREVAKLAHKYDTAFTVDTKATCEVAGSQSKHCESFKVCGSKTDVTPIAALGHAYGAWANLDAAQHQRICANDATHVDKADHVWVADPAKNTGTYAQENKMITYNCSVCAATKTEADKTGFQKFNISVSSGNVVVLASVYKDYSAVFKMPVGGKVDAAKAEVTVTMNDVAGLGIEGKRTHTIKINTGIDKSEIELDTWLYAITGVKVPAGQEDNVFEAATINGSVDSLTSTDAAKEFTYKLSIAHTADEYIIYALPTNEAAVRAAWTELVKNIKTTDNVDGEDSKMLLPAGSFLQIAGEKLTVDKNLLLDNLNNMTGLEQTIRDKVSLDVNATTTHGKDVYALLKADTMLSLGSSSASLKADTYIMADGFNEKIFSTTMLSDLRKSTGGVLIIKELLSSLNNVVSSANGQTISVDIKY